MQTIAETASNTILTPVIVGNQTDSRRSLRPYQIDAINDVILNWTKTVTPQSGKSRRSRPVISVATGGGKTVIFSELLHKVVNPETMRALVFAHSSEIIYQTVEKIRDQFGPDLKPFYGANFAPGIGIVMNTHDDENARIVVATRQSLHAKRLKSVLSHGVFDVVIIDEAHHGAADSYQEIIDTCFAANPECKIAGFTATPKRTDKKALGILFDEILTNWTILDGQAGGYLVPANCFTVKTTVNTSGVKVVKGDYQAEQLADVLNASNWSELAVKAYRENIENTNRPCIAFFPEVTMSKQFVLHLQEIGIAAAHIDANTPKEIRKQILADYSRGQLNVISNMGVLTEGTDLPRTAAILMARPTKSQTIYTQIVGRGLRLFPGKENCLIVELAVIDTKPLLKGEIFGKTETCENCGIEFYKGYKACPQCGTVPKPPEPKEKLEGDGLMQSLRNQMARTVEGSELRTQVRSLFDTMLAAWYDGGDGMRSTGVGFDKGALIIHDPLFTGDPDNYRNRIAKGIAMLPDCDPDDPADRADLLEQIEMLQRDLIRYDHYTLYYVPPTRDQAVKYIGADTDLTSLMQRADLEAIKRGGSDSAQQVKKDAKWRFKTPSDGQMGLVKRLGYPNPSEVQNKGQAAEIITHLLYANRVKGWIANDQLDAPAPVNTNIYGGSFAVKNY